jgi:hypothetical protein
MKIDDAIKSLIEVKKRGVKNIIFAHWEADLFDEKDDKDWEVICEHIDKEMDWGNAYDNIVAVMDLMTTTTAESIYDRNQPVMAAFFGDARYEDEDMHFELVEDILKAMMQAEGVDEFPKKIEDSIREQIIDGLT